MKALLKRIIQAFTLFSFLISCSNNNALIKGKLENAKGEILRLEELNISTRKILDSIKLNDKGAFSFKYKFNKEEPAFILLSTDSLILATLLVEKGEKLTYNANYNQISNYTIAGSNGSALVKELNDNLKKTYIKFDSITKSSNNEKIEQAASTLLIKHKQSLIRFIVTHPTSFASFTAIYQRLPNGISFFGKNTDMVYYKILVDSLSKYYPKSTYVQALNDDYEKIEKAIKMQNLLENAEVKEGLPEIELPNIEGRNIKLSSIKEKIILIDFWKASSKNQLMNNRELVDIYEKYKNYGFEIYQISEDEDIEYWKQSVHNQQIKWISVKDTPSAYIARLYNINTLPANYLINKSGTIVAKNIYGNNLEKKLKELFGR